MFIWIHVQSHLKYYHFSSAFIWNLGFAFLKTTFLSARCVELFFWKSMKYYLRSFKCLFAKFLRKKYSIWRKCENAQVIHNSYITKSWSETRVYWQCIFIGSWVLFSSASCLKSLTIFPFGACNLVYSQPKMNAHETFDAAAINMNGLGISIWGHVSSMNTYLLKCSLF